MSTLAVDTIEDSTATYSVPTTTVVAGSAKAWVIFDGTAGTIAPADSFNVSSLTDGGVGIYTVNFTNAMVDVNYAAFASGNPWLARAVNFATSSIDVYTYNTTPTATDFADVCAGVFDN